MTECGSDAEEYQRLRPLLFSIAYNMTGSVADAEDIVADAYLKLYRARADGTEIRTLKGFLTTVVSRLSISHLRLARVQRERYYGTWLPEPVVEENTPAVELSDSLSLAFLILLENLTPVERAVFLLHDVFDFEYGEVARIVGKSEVNSRQIAARARRHIDNERPRFDAAPGRSSELAERFVAAFENGDLEGLVELLAEDVVMYGDGGGRGPSFRKPTYGREKVLRVFAAVVTMLQRFDLHVEQGTVNGHPGALIRDASGSLLNVMSFDVYGGQVQTVHSIMNPGKLGHLAPLLGPDHPLRRPLRGQG